MDAIICRRRLSFLKFLSNAPSLLRWKSDGHRAYAWTLGHVQERNSDSKKEDVYCPFGQARIKHNCALYESYTSLYYCVVTVRNLVLRNHVIVYSWINIFTLKMPRQSYCSWCVGRKCEIQVLRLVYSLNIWIQYFKSVYM